MPPTSAVPAELEYVPPGTRRSFGTAQAETAEGRSDSLDPDAFKYEIIAREIE